MLDCSGVAQGRRLRHGSHGGVQARRLAVDDADGEQSHADHDRRGHGPRQHAAWDRPSHLSKRVLKEAIANHGESEGAKGEQELYTG